MAFLLSAFSTNMDVVQIVCVAHLCLELIRGLLEKYPTFGREKETGLLGALDT